jgi:SAM-dependent methyltransferase
VSLGFFLTGRRERLLAAAPLLLLATLAAAAGFHLLHAEGLLAVRVGDPHDPERLFFGTVWPSWQERRLALPVEASLLVIFAGTALVCAALGQRLGVLFADAPRRVRAYAVHLAGCVAGVLAFAGLSATGAGPLLWFVPALVLLGIEVRARLRGGVALALCAAVVAGLELPREGWTRWWSPYNRVDYQDAERLVFANGIGHQQIVDQGRAGEAYALPYAGARPRHVLVIGAGTGNDVATALAHGAERIDAVEIDPVLADLGRRAHPDRPYASPKVRLIRDDGRAFLERTQERYDLIVYGLVDSLTLHSSYGSVRLESYLFTREAFAAARDRLTPGGRLVITNYLRSGWLALRIAASLEEVFGVRPSVFTLPPRDEVVLEGPPDDGLTVLIAGADPPRTLSLGERTLRASTLGEVQLPMPTDDWPYPYLRARAVPAQNLRALGLLVAVSVLLAALLRAPVARGLDRHFLFLGAGFALIETTSLARLAAVLGTTWQMHAAVVAGVLGTSLVGTAWAAARPAMRSVPLYAGLAAALSLSWWCDAATLLALPTPVAAAALFAPLLFSGALFALGLARCPHPAAALGSNTIGVLLGVALEALTVVTGLRGATGLVAAAYALSFRRR